MYRLNGKEGVSMFRIGDVASIRKVGDGTVYDVCPTQDEVVVELVTGKKLQGFMIRADVKFLEQYIGRT